MHTSRVFRMKVKLKRWAHGSYRSLCMNIHICWQSIVFCALILYKTKNLNPESPRPGESCCCTLLPKKSKVITWTFYICSVNCQLWSFINSPKSSKLIRSFLSSYFLFIFLHKLLSFFATITYYINIIFLEIILFPAISL